MVVLCSTEILGVGRAALTAQERVRTPAAVTRAPVGPRNEPVALSRDGRSLCSFDGDRLSVLAWDPAAAGMSRWTSRRSETASGSFSPKLPLPDECARCNIIETNIRTTLRSQHPARSSVYTFWSRRSVDSVALRNCRAISAEPLHSPAPQCPTLVHNAQ